MDLRQHLQGARKTHAAFAKELGISREHLSRIINGHERPSKPLANLIEFATGGAVQKDVWAE